MAVESIEKLFRIKQTHPVIKQRRNLQAIANATLEISITQTLKFQHDSLTPTKLPHRPRVPSNGGTEQYQA
ncbi:hypothetical protein [Nostoc sp.]|uniref:hypothetical protein n=1 Tax=Nostoc sp. TaxID=1180 RepID=UPI002FF50523